MGTDISLNVEWRFLGQPDIYSLVGTLSSPLLLFLWVLFKCCSAQVPAHIHLAASVREDGEGGRDLELSSSRVTLEEMGLLGFGHRFDFRCFVF